MSWIDDAIRALRDYDRSRPRSQQRAVGWSEVGGRVVAEPDRVVEV